MKLYGYWRSSASYRVRIALHLKGVTFDSASVHLVNNGGEQHSAEFDALNPNHLVPTLVDGDFVLNQSLAIIDYLDEKYSQQPFYPKDKQAKAAVNAFALDIACEIHPLNNLRVLQYLTNTLGLDEEAKLAWINTWISNGFTSLEKRLTATAGKYCFDDEITKADICLIPQVYNAQRFGVNLSNFPTLTRVVENCLKHQAFVNALPENQPDAV